MGVDWYPCGICKETFCDAGQYYNCAKCEGYICEDCYSKQLKKYKKVKTGSEEADNWGDDSTRECDVCSVKNKANRIQELKRQLAEEENENTK